MPAVKSGDSPISLADMPPIYVLSFQLDIDELHELEEEVLGLGANLTYDAKEARIFLGRVAQKKRAAFELRSKGVWTEEAVRKTDEPPTKRVRLNPANDEVVSPKRSRSKTGSGSDTTSPASSRPTSPVSPEGAPHSPLLRYPDLQNHILVIRSDWVEASIKQNRVLPFDDFLVYDARIIPKPEGATTPNPSPTQMTRSRPPPAAPSGATIGTILARARAEGPSTPAAAKGFPTAYQPRRRFNQNPNHRSTSTSTPGLTHPAHPPPKLHRTTTSEFESHHATLPPAPDWVRNHVLYACCRSTPLRGPNAPFIAALETVKLARLLTLDEIGVRAYATSIAALAAYPNPITCAAEVLRLPGCDAKIAQLWSEWWDSAPASPQDSLQDSGKGEGEAEAEAEAEVQERFLPTARALEQDEHLQVLRRFYAIWGVGAETARKFYFERGWRDLDDVVEFGWAGLTRVQQIGVKFYDEFGRTIPRAEVEGIRDVVLRHARRVSGVEASPAEWGGERDVVAVIVGGYRRGKEESGDVDVVLSHRDPSVTENLVVDVVASLEREGWVTHTLTLNTTTSDRGQQTLPFRAQGGGHGFDSLDKALCVWQDPVFEGMGQEEGEEEGGGGEGPRKNPNVHRRVDIIVSAWRTVACAVLGWSGGNTFQRDLRRYVKRTKGWKFDSSGVRDRVSGRVLDLESPKSADEADTWLDREKRLMEGLGIGWRPPSERCTG